MRPLGIRYAAPLALSALGMLALTGCSGDGNNSSDSSPPTSVASTPASTPSATSPSVTQSTPASAPPSTPSPPKADVTINVTISGGKVNPSGATIRAKSGQTVLITATTDAADELHVHGYDKEAELTPGKPATIQFVANMKGTFEIETHESGKLIAKLVVS